jgi:large-conductance mechanosensitive channel
MQFDAVFWGAILSVAIAIIILVFLAFKVVKLMNRDAEEHRLQQ